LLDDLTDHLLFAQFRASGEGILDMFGEAITSIQHSGDAALGILGVTIVEPAFGNTATLPLLAACRAKTNPAMPLPKTR
jgi:hypothetical protein